MVKSGVVASCVGLTAEARGQRLQLVAEPATVYNGPVGTSVSVDA
jgi:hypothetical protein